MNVGSRVMADGSVELEIRQDANKRTTGAHITFVLGPKQWETFVRYVLTVKNVYMDPDHPSAKIIPGGKRIEAWKPPETIQAVAVTEEMDADELEAMTFRGEVPFRHNMTEGYGDDGHVS